MTTANTVARSVEYSLRFVGIWPGMPFTLVCRLAWILIIVIVLVPQYLYIFLHFKTEELSDLMDSLSVALEYTVMLVKLIILWLNNRTFYNVLATMATDWREATVTNTHIMTSKANLSRYLSNMIIGLLTFAGSCFSIGIILSYVSYVPDADETPSRNYLLRLQLPFEYNESPLYEIITCLEILHQLSACVINGMLNSLIVTLVLHASGQIDILCEAFEKISPEKYNRRVAISVTSQLVDKHQKIIAFSNDIEQLFCYMALIQFMSSTLVICFLGLMIVSSISSMQNSDLSDSSILLKAVVFYMAATVEAFIFCVCGEYLSAKSKMIGDAAYKSFWYEMEPSDSKFILFIILRSQRRLTITAGKIMDLSLEGFTSIIKGSMSYMSVLHAMY